MSKRKSSKEILKNFIVREYMKKIPGNGADTIDTAIRDLITDLFHIRYTENVSDSDFDKMDQIVESAKMVFCDEQEQIDSDRLHADVGEDKKPKKLSKEEQSDYFKACSKAKFKSCTKAKYEANWTRVVKAIKKGMSTIE